MFLFLTDYVRDVSNISILDALILLTGKFQDVSIYYKPNALFFIIIIIVFFYLSLFWIKSVMNNQKNIERREIENDLFDIYVSK